MLLRNIFDFMFASPVMAVSSIVSVACAGVLVVNITSNMAPSGDNSETHNSNGTLQHKSSLSNNVSNKNQLNVESGGDLNSGLNHKAGAGKFKSKPRKNTVQNNLNREYFENSTYSSPTSTNGVSTTINSAPSILNYSGFESSVSSNISTTSTPASDSSNNNDSSTVSGNSDTIISETPEADDPATITPEDDFPSSVESCVKIDQDETHCISCQPIEANGPPCMCTYTVTDANGTRNWVDDNCG